MDRMTTDTLKGHARTLLDALHANRQQWDTEAEWLAMGKATISCQLAMALCQAALQSDETKAELEARLAAAEARKKELQEEIDNLNYELSHVGETSYD